MQPMSALLSVLMLLIGRVPLVTSGDMTSHCQNEKFTARCQDDEVVVMETAVYGRMRRSHCVERDYGYLGCQETVLRQSDVMCSGRRTCEIPVPNPLFDATNPCPNDLKSFFEAGYKCVKVVKPPQNVCHSTMEFEITATSGYIASITTDETDIGSAQCPWILRSRPGQQINLTLFDFSMDPLEGACQAYAILREAQNSATICRGGLRERPVYISKSDRLEIRLVRPQNTDGHHFLLKFEVMGCADPPTPTGGWVNRKGQKATIGCDAGGDTWEVECNKNEWIGPHRNCSRIGQASGVFGDISWHKSRIPFGSSIIIVVAIALALGVIILIVGLSILKCRKYQTPPPRGVVLGDNYQTTATTKVADPVSGHRSLQVGSDQESMYQASENEYAYISDFQLPTDIQAQNLSNRHMELYKARKCYDYGIQPGANQPNKPVKQVMLPCSPAMDKKHPDTRHIGKGDHSFNHDGPPAYFELDPENENRGRGRRISQGSNTNCSAHGSERNILTRSNQSSGDFKGNNYDHLVDTSNSTNSNHKSV